VDNKTLPATKENYLQFVLTLPENSKQPIYKQVCDGLRQAIEEGRLRAGEKLPSTRELAISAKVSRFTAIRSYELLTAQGLIETKVGSGTFVTQKAAVTANTAQPPAEPAEALAEPAFSLFGKRMAQPQMIEAPDAELFQELNYGAPSIEQIPLRQWREVLNKCARFQDKTLFQYVSDPMGYMHLREAICAYLARARSIKCTSARLVLFSGAQSALDIICRLLLEPGNTVAVENPGFPGARRIFNAHGAKIITIPVDEDGLVVDELYKIDQPIKLIYVTPSHQDPMGVMMSMERRQQLLKWAQQSGAFILEDDHDSEFHYGEKPLAALQGLDRGDSVIYLASFWKVLFPVVRMAFLVLPKRLQAPVHQAKSYFERDFPLLEQIALTEFINAGTLERQVKRNKSVYARQRAALALVLAKRFKDRVTTYGISAGMHMILHFHKNMDKSKILQCAQQAGVPLVSTSKHYIADARANEFLIGFAHHSEEELTACINSFADLMAAG